MCPEGNDGGNRTDACHPAGVLRVLPIGDEGINPCIDDGDAESGESGADTTADRRRRYAQKRGCLHAGATAEVGETDRLPLGTRQCRCRRPQLRAGNEVQELILYGRGLDRTDVASLTAPPIAPRPHDVDRAAVALSQQERAQRASLGPEAFGASPEQKENVLNHFFGQRANRDNP